MKFYCNQCNCSYGLLSNLTKHQKIKHGLVKINKCECGKEFDNAQSLNAHYRWCLIHREGKPVIDTWQKGKPSKSRGKSLEDIVINPEATRKKLSDANKNRVPIKHTVEAKRKISEARTKYLEGNNHIEWFSVNGIKVQGKWEKQVAENFLELGINFSRIKLKYDVYRTYTPDFYLPDLDAYVEVKGWLSDRDKAKYLKVLLEYPHIKIFLIRDELGINNFTKFTSNKIKLEECEDMRTVIMGS